MAKIEIFISGSYLCNDVVEQTIDLACSKCEVTVFDLNKRTGTQEAEAQAKAYGIQSLPAVVINGNIVDFEKLKNAGLDHVIHSKKY